MKILARLCFALSMGAAALAQNAALPPFTIPQFFQNGVPCSGCQLHTYAAGTTNPLATYTDATASTPNQNPVIIDTQGRANIWLSNAAYRFVLDDASGALIWTADNLLSVGFSNSGPWTVTGSNLYNTAGGKVCVSNAACPTPLSQLNVVGTSGGTNLIRIDDSSNNPGVDFFGSGSKYGSVFGTTAGIRVAGSDGASQLIVAPGLVTIQNTSSGGTTNLTFRSGATQSTDFVTFRDGAGAVQAGITAAWGFYSPAFNSLGTGSAITFQNNNSNFSVDGNGDISSTAQINLAAAGGVTATAANLFKIGGTTVVDNSRNGFFNNITIAGTCSGAGCGGGGGGGYPVLDSVFTVANLATPTKKWMVDLSLISGSTTRTLKIPDVSGTIPTLENANTFTQVVTGSLGFAGTVFNSTATGTSTAFQLNNSNFTLDAKGNITLACASGCTAGTDGANIIVGGYLTAGTWVGLHPTSSAPATTPGGSYSGLSYKGGTSGLHVWLYDTVHTAWTDIDLGAVGGTGITSLNGQVGSAQTIIGTANEVIATTTTNTVTFSTPQPIGTTSDVTFDSVSLGAGTQVFQTGQTGCGGANPSFKTTNNSFTVDGCGNVTLAGSGAVLAISGTAGGLNITADLAATSIQTTGGIDVCNTNACTTGLAIEVNNAKLVDNNRNGFFNNMTVTGTCTGCVGSGLSNINAATGPGITLQGTSNQVTVATNTGTNTITLGTPQNIHTGATPTFAGMTLSAIAGSTQCLQVNSSGVISGTGVVCGGGSVVSSATGTVNQVLVNGTSGSAQTGAITLSLPQPVNQTANITFSSVNLTSGSQVFQSGQTGCGSFSPAFQTANTKFVVDGCGNVSGTGDANFTTSYKVNGTTIVNSSRGATFSALGISGTNTSLDSGGNITAQNGFFINNGSTFTGQTWTMCFPVTFTINGSGSFSCQIFRGGILVGAS